MTLRTRITRLERVARREPPGKSQMDDGPTELLLMLEQLDRQGLFDHEPDFPVALENFRSALEREQAEPQGETGLGLPNPLDALRPSPLLEAEQWLGEILTRAGQGVPPVTEAEFQELAEWFQEHESWICQSLGSSGFIGLGNGRRISTANLRYGLSQGPRVGGAGQLAEDVRQLKARMEGARPLPAFPEGEPIP